LWLDVLRVLATLIVVLSHVAYPRFTRGDYIILRELNLGSDAVVVFFVISGLVIAYAAQRDDNAGTYAFNRATRLFSVLLPALLLTFTFDQLGRSLDPSVYPPGFYQPTSLAELLFRGLTFSNEWGAWERLRLGTNGPLWSLSYEAAYYILFGVALFMTGARRVVVLIALLAVVGPRVMLLMPAWLMGVWAWRFIAAGGAGSLPRLAAIAMAIGGPLLYAGSLALHLPESLAQITADALAPANYRMVLAFSDEFLWNALVGVFTAIHVLGMAHLLAKSTRDSQRLRWWAGASFSIYVTHYPTLHIIHALFPVDSYVRDALFVFGTLSVGLIFAHLFERNIKGLRDCLKQMAGFKSVTDRPRSRPRPSPPPRWKPAPPQ
jgi:peptidoglycan/LPS O-acetylase OafA/YrhL